MSGGAQSDADSKALSWHCHGMAAQCKWGRPGQSRQGWSAYGRSLHMSVATDAIQG